MAEKERAPLSGICSICGKYYRGYGYKAAPVAEGWCCVHCFNGYVVPARTPKKSLSKEKEAELAELDRMTTETLRKINLLSPEPFEELPTKSLRQDKSGLFKRMWGNGEAWLEAYYNKSDGKLVSFSIAYGGEGGVKSFQYFEWSEKLAPGSTNFDPENVEIFREASINIDEPLATFIYRKMKSRLDNKKKVL